MDYLRLRKLLKKDIEGLRVLISRRTPDPGYPGPGNVSFLDNELRLRSEQLDMVNHLIAGGTINYWPRR